MTNLPADQQSALLAKILNKPTESYVMSTAHRLRQEGQAQEIAKSRRRLLTQLATRFGSVPPDIESRIHRSTGEDLDEWSVRLLHASSLLGVFAGE